MTGARASFRSLLRRLRDERRGSMAIETGLVAPVLVLMSIGSFEVSGMVARQQELQNGISQATEIALATNEGARTNTQTLERFLTSSLSLADEQVTVSKSYRCDATDELVANDTDCAEGEKVTTYIDVELTDTYTPIWTRIGMGSAFQYDVMRRVMIS